MFKAVNVAGVNYDVNEKTFVDIDGSRNYQGACFYANTEIQILEDLSDERKNSVLVHEMTHAIFYEAGFGEQDEDMVNRVANVLCQVLKSNDFSWMKERVKA